MGQIMKNIKTFILLGFISTMPLLLTSCSDDAEESANKKESTGDHVWKTQTDALQSAKDTSKKMQESMDQQQKTLNENN